MTCPHATGAAGHRQAGDGKEARRTRLFIGTSLAGTALAPAVAAYQGQLRRAGWEATWVAETAVHLTYLFLGDWPAEWARRLATALEAVAALPAVSWHLDQSGTFGPPQAPRAIWVGSRTVPRPLARIQAETLAAARAVGFEAESNPWRPHVTVARPRRGPSGPLPPWRPVTVAITQVALVHSTLTPSGPIYRPLHTVALRREATQRP
ncbi:MAG: RNA 2',3'-cyclic phosphodiesterase [Firmicutes bacterium]|nr:RNA 2',3'-cyclic phosphodiesterase [Alicyclobacillaceae bacterium]MCL6496509.1 RNA 2',3'-cyclic phosphodiesterase [Bacillota bacterium]